MEMSSELLVELEAACKLSFLDARRISEIFLQLQNKSQIESLPATVAHCLVTVLANRKEFSTRLQFLQLLEVVEVFLSLAPKCLEEIIELKLYAPGKAGRQPTGSGFVRPLHKLSSRHQIQASNSRSNTPNKSDLFNGNGSFPSLNEKDSTPDVLTDSKNASGKINHISSDQTAFPGSNYSGNIPHKKKVSNFSRENHHVSERPSFDSFSVSDSNPKLQQVYESSTLVRNKPAKSRSRFVSQGAVDLSPKNLEKIGSASDFNNDFGKLGTKVGNPDDMSRVARKMYQSFSFTPIYTLFELLCFKPKEKYLYENVGDLELKLVRTVCNSEFADVNMLLAVRSNISKNGYVEVYSYQPLWHRLLNTGKFGVLKELISKLDVNIRRTILEKSDTDYSRQLQASLSRQRKLSVKPNNNIETISSKKLVFSKTALHELCSWSTTKYEDINKTFAPLEPITGQVVLEFVQFLIENGADVNAVCVRKEDNHKLVKTMLRKYSDDVEFTFKPLPGKELYYYIWQTPLTLAIRSKNIELVKLLAKNGARKDIGEIFCPRNQGININLSASILQALNEGKDYQSPYKLAADLSYIPGDYSLRDHYLHASDFDNNFFQWKYVLDNEKLFNSCFPELLAVNTNAEPPSREDDRKRHRKKGELQTEKTLANDETYGQDEEQSNYEMDSSFGSKRSRRKNPAESSRLKSKINNDNMKANDKATEVPTRTRHINGKQKNRF